MAGLSVECGPRERTTLDKKYHVQAAAENFSANNTILGDRKVHVAAVRQHYFFRVITSMVYLVVDLARCTFATCTKWMLLAGDCDAKGLTRRWY